MKKRLALLVVLCFALPAVARADIVHLKGGRQVEGKVMGEKDGKLEVKTAFGVVRLDKAEIVRIEKKLTPREDYERRLRQIDRENPDHLYRLALFCKEHRLRKEEKELYKRILEIDDQHPGANEAVGNVEYEGRWMTPAERDRMTKDSEAAEKRAAGLVEHDGRWVTPEEKKNLEKGLVKYEGKWMTPDEVKRAKGYVKHKGEWVHKDDLERVKIVDAYGEALGMDVEVALSKHFAAAGPYGEDELQSVCDAAEQVYAQFSKIFRVGDAENLFAGAEEDAGRSRCHIVYTKKALAYTKMVDWMVKRYPQDLPPTRADLMKTQAGFYFVYPSCYIIGCQFPQTFDQVRASVIHKASHVLLMRYRYSSGFFPWWLIEGLGTYQEIAVMGRCDTYCITDVGYGAMDDPAKNKWSGEASFKTIVRQLVAGRTDRTLYSLSRAQLNDLSFRDLAKCWSLVDWWVEEYPDELIRLVALLKAKVKLEDATKQVFGKEPSALDKEWRDWVGANY